jgi:hypothetical protein
MNIKLIFVYNKFEIMMRISRKNNKIYDVLLKIGLKISKNIKYITMETNRNQVFPYIESRWNKIYKYE